MIEKAHFLPLQNYTILRLLTQKFLIIICNYVNIHPNKNTSKKETWYISAN